MELILTVTSANKSALGNEATRSFSTSGGSLGRGWNNTWVLPDAERYISSKHAEISFENGHFYLTDTSSNGVVIAASDAIIGRGNRVAISDGQEFFIGEYKVMATMDAGDDYAPSTPTSSEALDNSPEINNPLNNAAIDTFLGTSQDPLELLNGQNSHGSHLSAEPSLGDIIGGVDSDANLLQTVEVGTSDHQSTASGLESNLGHASGFNEPMQFARREQPASSTANVNVSNSSASRTSLEIPADWDMTEFSAEHQPPSASAPVPTHSIPQSLTGTGSIPNDEDFFAVPDTSKAATHSRQQRPNSLSENQLSVDTPVDIHSKEQHSGLRITDDHQVAHDTSFNESSELMGLLADDTPQPLKTPHQHTEANVTTEAEHTHKPETFFDDAPKSPVSASQAAMQIARNRQSSTQRNVATDMPKSDLLQRAQKAFESQNIAPEALTEDVAEQWLALMPTIMDGLTQLLLGRAQIKNEFRVSKTLLHAQENNPLKFSANGADAINNLFLHQRPGFMAPHAAIKEAFSDINIHQTALLHGLQEGLSELLESFDPNTLEKQFDQRHKRSGLLSKVGSNKYWQQYVERFDDFRIDSDDDFQRVLGATFAKAYDNCATEQGQSD
ncbi:Uncharacterised protein [BD1-7 clade bacterium]|uniref:FHA domain-containing protein n=1 Tax=BD1-7 clade bacterium TaxID=2029982 RepID=A0A5S9P0S4_9GAMM|nr:Uncharacterised protein [BD1-7 clade bacterium]CAA0116134.1 Uncharacterised protein [BD1-7 clade bacterium]CAA0119807.1 Uncharacterised protein [BD1-7 clade bacterium]